MPKLFFRLMLCAAASGLVYWLSGILQGLGAMRLPFVVATTGPLWVWALAPCLIQIVPALRRRALHDAWEPWNGRYYAYDGRQIRLYLVDGTIWVPVRDVATLFKPQPDARELRILGGDYGTIPGQKLQGYTEAGLLRMLTTRGSNRMADYGLVRFRNWLEREAFPNIRRLPGSST